MVTVVAFHAHPDDEVLLTGGTLARLAAEGHRVVIVVATDGIVGQATGPDLRNRLAELRASAARLGAARVEHLGYADSGHGPVLYPDPPGRTRFARADPGGAAAKLAALLREEHADLLLSYDSHGGYGHRDHVRVHEVGARAAALCGVRVWEATLPRELVLPVLTLLQLAAGGRRLRRGGHPGGVHPPVGHHPPGERPPLRRPEAGRPRRSPVVRAQRGPGPAPAPGHGGAAGAALRAPVRPGMVHRTRRPWASRQ